MALSWQCKTEKDLLPSKFNFTNPCLLSRNGSIHVNFMWFTAFSVNIGWILLHSICFSWNNDIQILGKTLARNNSSQENHHLGLDISSTEVFYAFNQQIWVHSFLRAWRDKCVLYKDYNQNIKKRNLIDRIFNFRRCHIIRWWQSTEPYDRAWFGCCLRRHTPSDDYGIPTCDPNDVMRNAVELFLRSIRWAEDTNTRSETRNTCFSNITLAQIS